MLSTLLAAALTVAPAPLPPPARQDDIPALVERLEKAGDNAEVETIDALAKFGSRRACEALIEFYDTAGSVFVHDALLRALARFDGTESGELAVEKIANVAANAAEPELRMTAVSQLEACPNLGKHYLRQIVESAAPDAVRVASLEAHARLATDEDREWYRELYQPGEDRAERAKRRAARNRPGAEEAGGEAHRLDSVRFVAFKALAPSLSERDLSKAYKDEPEPDVRIWIVEELARRDHKDAVKLAEEILESVDGPSDQRARAARVYLDKRGARAGSDLIKLAHKMVTPGDLRQAIAQLLAQLADAKLDASLVKAISKGKPFERAFAMDALAGRGDERARGRVLESLEEREPETRAAAVRYLGRTGEAALAGELRPLLDTEKDKRVLIELVKALSALLPDDAEWAADLRAMASADDDTRHPAALAQLTAEVDPADKPLFLELLEHKRWSTRLAALAALVELRSPDVLGPIVSRMGQESGRPALAFADALFELTGKPFGNRAKAWQQWYESGGKDEPLADPAAVAQARSARAEHEARQRTGVARFFGIPIESTRVIFVIDISGSMLESLRGKYVGEPGEVRIERAKKELVGALKDLPGNALFNILPFSSAFDEWRRGGIATSDGGTVEAAIEFVQGLGAIGGTNLYGALRRAMEDPDVDTIVVLSDGEPSMGDLTEPGSIRAAIAEANEGRDIQFHCVALGGRLRLLEWLAEDSGGEYVNIDQ